ncbi:MAG: NAD-glutamate dehydrogenase [Gammaproteobacteria bacterium]
MSITELDRTQILQQVLALASQKVSQQTLKPFQQFIERLYAYTPLFDLQQRTIENLLGAAGSLWELMLERRQGEYKRRIFNPQLPAEGWETSHTVLQFILDDQPFLVDTICAEINRQGLAVHFLAHPGQTKILRNAQHEIVDLLAADTDNHDKAVLPEAPIYIEIDRQTDPKLLAELESNIDRVVNDARIAVADWTKMRKEVEKALAEMDQIKPPASEEDIEESKKFLSWILDNHFTFLGFRRYDTVIEGQQRGLKLVEKCGLGVLKDTTQSKKIRYYAEIPEGACQLGLSNQIILLAKTNTRSTVHGRRYTDFISVKRFDETGNIIGERWFVGLLTSNVYNDNPRTFPLVRLKISKILQSSGLPLNGHAYKALAHILETLPRDDLFHFSIRELTDLSMGILALQDKRCVRLFALKDIYDRFISCLVYVPRDDFNITLCNHMQEILLKGFHGLEISYETLFPDSVLARIHFTIRVNPKELHHYDIKTIEKQLIEVATSWQDSLHQGLLQFFGEERGNKLNLRYRHAFPGNYQEDFTATTAVADIAKMEQLSASDELQLSLYDTDGFNQQIHFKLFHLNSTIALSDAIPILEKMGLRVISEQPYKIQSKEGEVVFINDFNMLFCCGPLLLQETRDIFQTAFKKIWLGEAEHDGFNALVLGAQLNWREIVMLRAYAKYLKQAGFNFSQDYIEQTLMHNPEIARLLVKLFTLRFNPALQHVSTSAIVMELEKEITAALDKVLNLDEDRILRAFLTLIQATMRTNYFQTHNQSLKSYLSFKFNPEHIHGLPLPKPMHEIFVYSPKFEALHLRAGNVARGGIRWSDRREDFRDEVLGLMKAQQVKNAVIVPAGAKGGFVPKAIPSDATREQIQREGVLCYQDFMRGMLDLTDNLKGSVVIPPQDTVCHDGNDPYLVVAADKGTASFSDIANAIAKEYDFWLGDAFASGGSTGYDHKKIAITARGAWESVKQHFQELAIDIEHQPFTVMGVGDMSGDVFGNGMLRSRQIKMVAAFNGTHIFIDPNPDPEISFQERQRLFDLPRSTWEDYNSALLSAGGGIFRRSLKSIQLSSEARAVLGIDRAQLTPDECIQAILMAPLDLFWNGGIGTFVKSTTETAADVRDKTNDSIRVDGRDLRCKVVVEGGNLGFTQLGRIEYELNGGRINTDFIDNSGGVDCSDHEVNIKILLNEVVAQGQLTEADRNALLSAMTNEVAELVLHNNYRQGHAISLAVAQSIKYPDLYMRFIKDCTKKGALNPKLEFLPNDEVMLARKAMGKGLTRPEIAVLLAYSKIILKAAILQSNLAEEPYLNQFIKEAFPRPLRQNYFAAMEQHRLKKEILATQLSNALITDMGITFVYQMQDETRADTAEVVKAYVIAKEIFGLEGVWDDIEQLSITNALQKDLLLEVVRLIRRAVRWFLRNRQESLGVEVQINHFAPAILHFKPQMSELLQGNDKRYLEQATAEWIQAGVPSALAEQIAQMRALTAILNIVDIADSLHRSVSSVAELYFTLGNRLCLDEFRELVNGYPVDNHWMVLGRSAIKAELDKQQRILTLLVLQQRDSQDAKPDALLDTWVEKHQLRVERWLSLLAEMKNSPMEYSIMVVALRELANLAQNSCGN